MWLKNKVTFKSLALLVIAISLIACNGKSTWVYMFNGENLDGWQVKCLPEDSSKNYWTVEDGAITCNSMDDRDHNYVWLMSEKEYSDFEFHVNFNISFIACLERAKHSLHAVFFSTRYLALLIAGPYSTYNIVLFPKRPSQA